MVVHCLEIGIVPKRVSLRKDDDKDGELYNELHAEDPLGVNPYLPTGYVLSTWWVLKQNTQHGPTRSILITF